MLQGGSVAWYISGRQSLVIDMTTTRLYIDGHELQTAYETEGEQSCIS